jgi:hypothetical protein
VSDGLLGRIEQQDATIPDLPRPHREQYTRGLVVRLERIPDVTPQGFLDDPFVFQVAPLNTFGISRSYPQNTYDTVARVQRSRPGVRQLRSISYDTLFCADPWSWTMLHGDGYTPNPRDMLFHLESLAEQNAYFWLTVRNPARYAGFDVNWAAAIVDLNSSIHEGEPDDLYMTIGFQEYRDASLKTRTLPGAGSRNSKLPVRLQANQLPANRNTLYELATFYYGQASEWRRIARANNLTNTNPSADLTKLGHRKITVPRKP